MRKKTGIILCVFGLFALVCASIYSYDLTRDEKEQTYKELELFADSLSLVQHKYVENVEPKDLVFGALSGMLDSLDPYSSFMTPEDYKELLVETSGKFGGLGIEIALREGILTVVTPLEGTPAWTADLKPNDKIVKIDDKLTKGTTLNEAVKLLRGDPGTEVNLTILREKESRIFDVLIKRAIISVKDIRKSLILEDGIGYIRIAEFREKTAADLRAAVKKLEADGMQGMIVDLRSNPGGLLDSAVDVASLFIESGKLVVYTLDRDGQKEEYKSRRFTDSILDIPMVILVNDGSASGSEIVAGCIQDYRRGLILGIKTYGKASVQTVIPLTDGAALRLTTAKYYTPNGRLIHEKGIEPDIFVEQRNIAKDDPSKEDEVFEKIETHDKEENGDSKKDSKEEEDAGFYKTDYQIIRALDLVKGLTILNK